MEKRYVIGIDYGTLSGRAILLDGLTGEELAVSELAYPHGVMDEQLPSGKPLPERFALQHPADYLEVLRRTIPDLLETGGIPADAVAGLGIDFTACTLLPLDRRGVPLCFDPAYANEPHAYVKLWKHHAAQTEADEITALARERGEDWLNMYGGKLSSEWALPKILEIYRRAPEVYAAADRFAEAADWLSFVLTGRETHSAAFAGYKNLWRAKKGYPSREFFAALKPAFADLIGTKLSAEVNTADQIAGYLSAEGAALTGLAEGTAVSLPMIDAHAAMPAVGAVEPGDFVMIIGTSSCHLLQADRAPEIRGICGFARDAVVPGCITYEAGQACVGDGFAWFTRRFLPASYTEEAEQAGISVHRLLRERAEKLAVGESGLIALDWFNGNRSVLNDADLSGVILGLTLRTRPEEIYRALLEASAFGTRMILERFAEGGLPVREVVATGGIARKDPFMMQIYADVLGRPIRVAETTQAGALGSAIYAAAAGGLYPSVKEAARQLASPCTKVYSPDPARAARYTRLYREYVILHDYFGRGGNDVMKRLAAKEEK